MASLALAPAHPKLQELGKALLAAARQKRGQPVDAAPVAKSDATPYTSWETIETASFRVRHQGARQMAEAVVKAAEAKRKDAFERWSGPSSGGWEPKCEIVLHPNADSYAKITGQPAHGTGHTKVLFTNGMVAERRIELRADDTTMIEDALPRELTHVVLADLFPNQPPPRWAEAGMAVLACSPMEVGRYTRTLTRCSREGGLLPVATLCELKDYPGADKITGFYCESVSLVEYLVKLRGERNFTIFLRDAQRYGMASALRKTYGFDGPSGLETYWRQHALTSSRAQSP